MPKARRRWITVKNQAAYLGRIKDFWFLNQKEILGLIFSKIFIKNRISRARKNPEISPSFYHPFDKLFSDAQKSKIRRKERKKWRDITYSPTADNWLQIYHKLKQVLEFIYKDEL